MSEPGEFKRLAMDVVGNVACLGVYFARLEQAEEVVSALKALILDWPMDFIFIEGHTPEIIKEKKFKWAVNMSAGIEKLRQHCGLEHMNVMRIVAAAAEFVRRSLASGKKATVALVRQYFGRRR